VLIPLEKQLECSYGLIPYRRGYFISFYPALKWLAIWRAYMTETTLTNDERRCLQMWFRQAIAKLELEEVTNVMLENYPLEDETANAHKSVVTRRRASRGKLSSHIKELSV
jgi:hypothetical protein